MAYENEVFTLSVKEFNSLQEQIVKLKTQNFELTQKALSSQQLAQTPPPQPKDNSEQLSKLVERQQKMRKKNLKLQNEAKEWRRQAHILGDKLEREKNSKSQVQKDGKNILEKMKLELNTSWKKKLDLEIDNSKKISNDIKERHKSEIRKLKLYQKDVENRLKHKEKEFDKLNGEFEEKLRAEVRKLESKMKYQRSEYEKVLGDMKEKYRNEMKRLDTKMKNQQRENDKSQTESKEKFENRIVHKERELEKLIQESKQKIRNEQIKQETIAKQQQLKNDRALVEYREKLVQEKRLMEQKFLQKQKEDEKEVKFYIKKKNMHKKKKNDARFQVNELNRIVVKLRKEIKDKDNQIISLNKKTSEMDALRGEVRLEKEKLEKSHEYLLREKREVEKLNSSLNFLRKQEKRAKKDNHDKFTEMRRRIRSLEREVKHLSGNYIHHMVKDTLSKLTIMNENKEKEKYIHLYGQSKEKCKLLSDSHREFQSEVKVLKVAVEDSKIENEISQRQNKQLIRELKSHVKHQKSEFRKKVKRLESEKKDLKRKRETGMEDGSEVEGENRSRRSSTKSSTSTTSSLSTPSSMKKKMSFSPGPASPTIPRKGGSVVDPFSPEFARLKKDNGELIRKLTKFQKVTWNMEDKMKILQNKIFERDEEIEKKQNIIRDYMMRERLGRLSPMQTMKYNNNNIEDETATPTSPGIIRGLFTARKKKPVTGTSQLGFNRMQKVLEETILKNIQLHDNMKIMGEEVARLMEENKKINNLKLNSMSKLE